MDSSITKELEWGGQTGDFAIGVDGAVVTAGIASGDAGNSDENGIWVSIASISTSLLRSMTVADVDAGYSAGTSSSSAFTVNKCR